MSIIRPWPYAAKAVIQHQWDTNHLDVWVTFRFSMDQSVKPANDLWLCEADGVPKAVTVSAWQDAWTILLTIPDVPALPGEVTLEYNGPNENLKTTWNKQWEPWGPILSINVPYGWENIIFVDTINKRVGINGPPLTETFEIASHDGTDRIKIFHDDSDSWLTWTDGVFNFQTDEGTNTNTDIRTFGKGSGYGIWRLYAPNNTHHFFLAMSSAGAFFRTSTAAAGPIFFQDHAAVGVNFFYSATDGEVPTIDVHGYTPGDQNRKLSVGMHVSIHDTTSFSGTSNYHFTGNVHSTGRLTSATLTHSALGPTDDLDVSGVNTVFIDCSTNAVTIGGFTGGVDGQVLHIVRLCAAVNDATLEHNEATGNQDIFLHAGADETLTGEYGGWTLVCNGSNWYDISHAKHV